VIAAGVFAWIVVPLIAAGIVSCCCACCAAVRGITRRLDFRRWEQTTQAKDVHHDDLLDLYDDLDDLLRRAAAGESWWT